MKTDFRPRKAQAIREQQQSSKRLDLTILGIAALVTILSFYLNKGA